MSTPDPVPVLPTLRQILPRLLGGLVVMLFGVGLLAFTLREPITALSTWFITAVGWPGLMLRIAATDLVPILSYGSVLLVGHTGGLGYWTATLAAAVGAVLGVLVGWSVGRLFGRVGWIQRLLERYWISHVLQRYGIWAVAIASLTPIPDSLCVIGSGASKVPLWQPMLGATVRLPKIMIYLAVIDAGWSMGG